MMMQPDRMWLGVGLLGQGLFASRFLVQWIGSEIEGRSVIPKAFWYLSLAGSVILFAYAVHRHDVVFSLGQGTGLLIYARNLSLLKRGEASHSPAAPQPAS